MQTTTPDTRPARRTGRILLGESALVATVLAAIGPVPASRFAWSVAALVFAALAFARWDGRDLGARLADAARFAVRRHTLAAPIDPDTSVIATLELGDTAHVSGATIRIPGPAELRRPGDSATLAIQPVVVTGSGYQRIFLTIRIDPAADGTLHGTLRRIRRRLDALDVPHHPVDPGATVEAVLGAGRVREAWDHLVTDSGVQATLRVRLGAAGMTADLLVRLTAALGVTTILTWSDVDATLRLAAPSTNALAKAARRVVASAGVRVERLDGRHLPALWTTLPLGATGPVATRPESLVLRPAGLLIGHDRYGQQLRIRVPPDSGEPLRIVVTGDGAAARLIDARVRAVGVPVVVSTVERPAEADTVALAGADVVICHAMPAEDAAAVATALGLAEAGAWLSRIRNDMVAVVSDGTVRWALLPPGTVESQRITSLAGVART